MKLSTGTTMGLLACALILAGMSGCNMFKGAGRDIQKGGQAVENAADDTQREMHHKRPHSVTASAEYGGTISPSGDNRMAHGASRTFIVKANRGHHVADVLVDGRSVGAVGRYTFENVTEHHTISALFTENPNH